MVPTEKHVSYELYVAEYRTEEEMKIKILDIQSKVKMFIKIYHKIDNELLVEDEQIIFAADKGGIQTEK